MARGLLLVCVLFFVIARAQALDKVLYLVGGDLDDNNTEIWTSMIHYAGGPNGTMCVITAASADPCCGPDSSWPYYLQLFTLWGAKNVVYIPIDVAHMQQAYNQTVVAQLRQCTGWFFSGGDQTRVTTSFFTADTPRRDTPALQAIRDTFNANGGVIAGSSAGTACQPSGVMITDGWSYYGLLDGTKALPFPNPSENDVTYDANGGIGFFDSGLLDTHFGERGRQGRFIRLLLDTQAQSPRGRTIGFGMDQNTALVVSLSTNTAAVVGTGGINIFNVAAATVDSSAAYFTVKNVRYSYATPGDTVDVRTGAISFAPYKTPLAGREGALPPPTSTDVFNSPDNPATPGPATKQFILVAAGLFNSTAASTTSSTYEQKPPFGVTLIKDAQSIGYQGVTVGVSFTSFTNLRVDIAPLDYNPKSGASAAPIITVVVVIAIVVAVFYAIYYFRKKADAALERDNSAFNHVSLPEFDEHL